LTDYLYNCCFKYHLERLSIGLSYINIQGDKLTVSIYDIDALDGKEAAKALDQYIKKLEKGKVEGLTEKQINSLIKVAKILRTTLRQKKLQAC
jgi:hypothetical protein